MEKCKSYGQLKKHVYDHFIRVTQPLNTVQWDTKFLLYFSLEGALKVSYREQGKNSSTVSSVQCLTVKIS